MNLHLSFHSITALAYTIPNIYLFLRMRSLFISRQNWLRYTTIYLLIASIYPVGNILPGEAGFLKYNLAVISNYLVPFYLYLFLSVILFDVFLLLNRLLKLIPAERIKSHSTRKICLTLIIFLSMAVVIAGVINFNTIRISEYRIDVPRRSSKLTHLRIAFAADFHLKAKSNLSFVQEFAAKIADIRPDLMIFGGDIVDGKRETDDMSAYEKLLRSINAGYGVYAVLGNHEFYSGQDRGSFFDNAGMKVLCDTIVVIDSSFNLVGRFDSHFIDRKSVKDLLKDAVDTLPLILIDHRPTEIDQVSSTSADVQLSGHTHNGQLFPINLITRSVYSLSWGHIKKGNTHLFVTSGIRLWGPPVRTTGKSEIMVIDINFIPS